MTPAVFTANFDRVNSLHFVRKISVKPQSSVISWQKNFLVGKTRKHGWSGLAFGLNILGQSLYAGWRLRRERNTALKVLFKLRGNQQPKHIHALPCPGSVVRNNLPLCVSRVRKGLSSTLVKERHGFFPRALKVTFDSEFLRELFSFLQQNRCKIIFLLSASE